MKLNNNTLFFEVYLKIRLVVFDIQLKVETETKL